MTTTAKAAQAQEAKRLLDLSEAARHRDSVNAAKSRTGTLIGADLDASIAAHREVAEACEAFRQRYYPRSGGVFAASGLVCVLSPRRRRGRIVAEQSINHHTSKETDR